MNSNPSSFDEKLDTVYKLKSNKYRLKNGANLMNECLTSGDIAHAIVVANTIPLEKYFSDEKIVKDILENICVHNQLITFKWFIKRYNVGFQTPHQIKHLFKVSIINDSYELATYIIDIAGNMVKNNQIQSNPFDRIFAMKMILKCYGKIILIRAIIYAINF